MTKIDTTFGNALHLDTDSFVTDYTNDEEKSIAKRGVEITIDNPDYQHGSFHLLNPHRIPYLAVNFEHNGAFFRRDDIFGNKSRNCECMFVSSYAKKKKWALLLELKYGKEKNISINANDAFDELEKSFEELKKKDVINVSEYRVCFNISFPEYSSKEPFDAFVLDQDESIRYKKQKGVTIWGYNAIVIMTGAHLVPFQHDNE